MIIILSKKSRNFSLPSRREPAGVETKSDEDVEGQEGGDDDVGQIDDLAHLEVDGHAADGVGLLTGVAVLVAQVLDHVGHGVAGGQREVLELVAARPTDTDAGGGEEPAGRLEL